MLLVAALVEANNIWAGMFPASNGLALHQQQQQCRHNVDLPLIQERGSFLRQQPSNRSCNS